MKDISLRQYQDSDQKTVWQLHIDGLNQTGSRLNNPEYDQDILKIKETYLDNGGDFFVACLGEEVVGMGALKKVDDTTGEIKRMRVNINHQRKGIGTKILEKLLERAKDIGYKKIILDTSENQKAAKQLYERYGFKEFHRKPTAHIEMIFYEKNLD
jgi:ribosomal protein S18 acetylase RimI-like enzyme